MVDLHCHTTCSDGTFTPTELVDHAVKMGLSAVAVTDHDTVSGIEEAMEHAKDLREKNLPSVEVIPGIEFSAENEGEEIHIVGLFIDHKSDIFEDYLESCVESRKKRNRQICALLNENGMEITEEELESENPGSVIARGHIAALLLKKGYIRSMQEAFDRYIGTGKPCFVPREKKSCEDVIRFIKKAGGIPVLAHPTLYHMSHRKLDSLTAKLTGFGLKGIETYYSTYTLAEERKILSLANKYHLLPSGGSDFHGKNKPGIELGVGRGKLYIHDRVLSDLKSEKERSDKAKILFTDMDGTLLNDKSEVSPEMKKALDEFIERGNRLVLSSGRPLSSILEQVVKFGLNYTDLIIISNNGGLVYRPSSDEILYKTMVDIDTVLKIEEIAAKYGIHVQGYNDRELVVHNEGEEVDFYRRRIKMPVKTVPSIAEYLEEYGGSLKMLAIDLYDHEKLVSFKEELDRVLSDRVDVFFSNERYLEIIKKGTSKGEALKFVTDHLCMNINSTIAAGDEENDIPMIKAAGLGVAMKNARESVKEAADIVTEKSNDDDGLMDIICRY